MPLANVRVIGHYMGGGFGAKLRSGKYADHRGPAGEEDGPPGAPVPSRASR